MRRRLCTMVVLAVGLVLLSASPASAHAGASGEPETTNYRSRILSVEPELPDFSIQVIDAGSRLELVNRTGSEIVVLGYEEEPYLRLTKDGVYENTRSRATYLNANRNASIEVPSDVGPEYTPEWRKVSSERTARWHDHRAHWMGSDPPVVTDAPDRVHVLIPSFTVPVRVGDRLVEVKGDVTWIPPPSPWPWVALITACIVVLGVLGRLGWWRGTTYVALALLLAMSAVDAIGTWNATADTTLTKLGALTTPAMAWTVALGAFVMLHRAPRDAVLLGTGAATGIAMFFGVISFTFLTRSQLPTALPFALARLSVALCLGLGFGMVLMTGLSWRVLPAPAREQLEAPAPSAPSPTTKTVVRRERRLLLIWGGMALLVVAIAVGRAGTDTDTPAAVGATVEGSARAHDALCTALTAAAAGRVDEARAVFFDRAHNALHDTAADAERADRAASARLLEAKQRVEADAASAPTKLAADLRALLPTVRAAIAATGEPTPAACPGE